MTHVPAPRDITTVYRLGEIAYVPHYHRLHVFVGPGYKTYSKHELRNAGAVAEKMYLWPRPQFTSQVTK